MEAPVGGGRPLAEYENTMAVFHMPFQTCGATFEKNEPKTKTEKKKRKKAKNEKWKDKIEKNIWARSLMKLKWSKGTWGEISS